jgi:hypothetical protein
MDQLPHQHGSYKHLLKALHRSNYTVFPGPKIHMAMANGKSGQSGLRKKTSYVLGMSGVEDLGQGCGPCPSVADVPYQQILHPFGSEM